MKLLSDGGTNSKTIKGERFGYKTAILYLAPANLSGKNVCPWASKGCRAACLATTSGRMRFDSVRQAQLRRTDWFFRDRAGFIEQLKSDIAALVRQCNKTGMKPCVRLNVACAIVWERVAPELFTLFPSVLFYDYTKSVERFDRELPPNYHLTYSYSDAPEAKAHANMVLSAGHNVAVVFHGGLPENFGVWRVVPGDESDLRFKELDGSGVVVGLKAKGGAKHDTTGFVIHTELHADGYFYPVKTRIPLPMAA